MTAVDDYFSSFNELAKAVALTDMSGQTFVEEIGSKTLLIAAAGDLEVRFCRAIEECFEASNPKTHLNVFVRNQALKRKFFTMFNWDAANVNTFLGLFGDDKKTEMAQFLSEHPYNEEMQAFLFIGRFRNKVVHDGLASTSLESTIDDVYDKYRKALAFVNFVRLNI